MVTKFSKAPQGPSIYPQTGSGATRMIGAVTTPYHVTLSNASHTLVLAAQFFGYATRLVENDNGG